MISSGRNLSFDYPGISIQVVEKITLGRVTKIA